MRITPFLLVGFDGQIIDLPGSIVLPTRSAPPVPNRGLKGHVKRLPYCQTSVSGDLVPFCLDAGRRVLGTATGPSGQYVYIPRLPYECQTKLPEMSDADKGPYGIGIRAGYDPNSPGQDQGASSARQERRLHHDFRRDSRGDRSVHRREVRAGLHPQAHDRTAERERRGPPAAREVGRLRLRRGRGPQCGPGVCPASAPQGHRRGRAIGRCGGNARPPRRAGRAGRGGAPRGGIKGGARGHGRHPGPNGPRPAWVSPPAGRRGRGAGGTGTGVAPHVAELAQGAGSVVISLATTPFRLERGRMVNARAGIQRLRDRTDSLILLYNNRLLDLVPNLPVERAFAVMDHLIGDVVKGITESITVPSLINLDFSDVRTILHSGGTSTVFYGENADSDQDRLV